MILSCVLSTLLVVQQIGQQLHLQPLTREGDLGNQDSVLHVQGSCNQIEAPEKQSALHWPATAASASLCTRSKTTGSRLSRASNFWRMSAASLAGTL
ncbi:hypothetical protein WJX73_009968 [Symbiochloris irregularis]|uniref:Secreted protein n=1 Tax=Symbiochloris irregularis TaxID=706552 RepID=A0AAW1PND4_9CHLO